eukprot:jgi/Mesvir1/17369/Mv26479-RA.1
MGWLRDITTASHGNTSWRGHQYCLNALLVVKSTSVWPLVRSVDIACIFLDLVDMAVHVSRGTDAEHRVGLDDILSLRGVGAMIMAEIPLRARIEMRVFSRAFRAAVDDSLAMQDHITCTDVLPVPPRTLAKEPLFIRLFRCGSFARSCAGQDAGFSASRAITWLASRCPNLTLVSMRECCPGLNRVQASFLDHLPRKHVLDTSESYDPTLLPMAELADEALAALSTCTQLQYLDCYRSRSLTDKGLRAVAAGCSKLRYLNVARCPLLTDESIGVLAQHCPSLCALDVSYTAITDESLCSLVARCPLLEYLNVGGCSGVGDTLLLTLARSPCALRYLNVMMCGVISDSGVAALASPASCQLEYLNLGGNRRVSDASVLPLGACMPALRFLGVGYCVRVGDAALATMLTHCRHLQCVHVFLNFHITASTIRQCKAAGVKVVW